MNLKKNEYRESSSCLSLLEFSDDASSSSTSSTCGPLYELADLMAQLPIKRGLSKFYCGKSQTFASLSNVKRSEDLGKKKTSCSRRMKWYKFGPKETIVKRSTRTSCSSSFATSKGAMIIPS